MTEENSAPTAQNPWIIGTRDLSRQPGTSRTVQRDLPVTTPMGVPDVITVPEGAMVSVDLLLESVVEGVLVTGPARASTSGQCARCLDPLGSEIEVELTELFAYPDSTTDNTADEDEVSKLIDDKIDLEPLVRDALVLALPLVPLCSEDCWGLCPGCGAKWADLEPGHEHETIDPRWAPLAEHLEEMSQDSSAESPDQTE